MIECSSIKLNSIGFKLTGAVTGAADSPAPGDNKKCMAPRAMAYNGDDNIEDQGNLIAQGD